MEQRTFRWIPELGLDEAAGFMLQQEMSTLNFYSPQTLLPTSSSESLIFYPSAALSVGNSMEASQGVYEAEQVMFVVADSDSPLLLSFKQPVEAESIAYQTDVPKDYGSKRKGGMVNCESEKKKMKMMMSVGLGQAAYAFDHIVAERRRREKLGQSFKALAAIMPDLKKMDKASVLEDAIKHIKELEERVKMLEDKIARKTVEIFHFKARHDNTNDCESPISSAEDSNGNDNGSSFDQKLTKGFEIEVKFCEKAVLVKVYCENQKGALAKMVSAVEELQLKVESFGAVPFMGSSFLDITLIAQVEEVCSIALEDVAKKLKTSLSQCD